MARNCAPGNLEVPQCAIAHWGSLVPLAPRNDGGEVPRNFVIGNRERTGLRVVLTAALVRERARVSRQGVILCANTSWQPPLPLHSPLRRPRSPPTRAGSSR